MSDSINKAFVKVSGPTKTRFGIRGENKTRVSEVSVVGTTLHVFLAFMGMNQPRKHPIPMVKLETPPKGSEEERKGEEDCVMGEGDDDPFGERKRKQKGEWGKWGCEKHKTLA